MVTSTSAAVGTLMFWFRLYRLIRLLALADSARYPIYGSGIVATSLPRNLQTPGGNPLPGDIMVMTPHG